MRFDHHKETRRTPAREASQASAGPTGAREQDYAKAPAENAVTKAFRIWAQEVPETRWCARARATTGLLRMREGCARQNLQSEYLLGTCDGSQVFEMRVAG